MESTWNFSPLTQSENATDYICRMAQNVSSLRKDNTISTPLLDFRKVTPEAMKEIWPILRNEPGRTTDFSYGGVLMWVDYFNYEYAIYKDTLFIKGVVESDLSRPAFSLPVGALPLKESISLLRDHCKAEHTRLEFSAVPEYALQDMVDSGADMTEELTHWGDYLYDAESLATLKGKKMSKKRNHVNQFSTRYPDWKAVPLDASNASAAMEIMDAMESEGSDSDMARSERELSRKMIKRIVEADSILEGMIIFAEGKACAFTIGDVKGDTLFIHIEKALREYNGSYEIINQQFAKAMCDKYPEIKYVNREDDAGDIGLRMAKESYHPLEILRKYNVTFFGNTKE